MGQRVARHVAATAATFGDVSERDTSGGETQDTVSNRLADRFPELSFNELPECTQVLPKQITAALSDRRDG